MSINNVFGVSLTHPLYDVDELLLEEDHCNLQTTHASFLMKEQLTAFVSGYSIVSSPGVMMSNNNEQQQQSQRDLEAKAVIQVPLWVARALVPNQHAILISPEKYNSRSLLDFKAGAFLPLVAETKGQRFFDYGCVVSAFLPLAEANRVRDAAMDLYKNRYADVIMEGLKKGSTWTRDASLRAKLTTREQELYNAVAQDVQWRTAWRRWLN